MNETVISAYLIGVVVMFVSLLIAMILTNMVVEKGGGKRTTGPRRFRFWLMTILTPIAILVICYFAVYQDIKVPSRQTAYLMAMAISAGSFFVLQIILGIVLSKTDIFNQRLQSWF